MPVVLKKFTKLNLTLADITGTFLNADILAIRDVFPHQNGCVFWNLPKRHFQFPKKNAVDFSRYIEATLDLVGQLTALDHKIRPWKKCKC